MTAMGLVVRRATPKTADGRAAMRAGDVDVVLVNHDVVIAPDADGPWRVAHLVARGGRRPHSSR